MKEIEALMAENEKLSKENDLLRKENAELKRQLDILSRKTADGPASNTVEAPSCGVTKFSSPGEKIALFRSLFAGRTDVFARRWYGVTSEKSGYQPVCGNEWDGTLCDKKKYKCSACPNRKLLPLTDSDLFAHLSGRDKYARDVVGVYPMLTDETCVFCCVDFDEEDYQEAANAYRAVCEANGIPAYAERSRSGKGAHV